MRIIEKREAGMRRAAGCVLLGAVLVSMVLGAEDAAKKGRTVLLALEDTRFKKALVEEMKQALEKQKIAVVVMEHTAVSIKEVDATMYDVVFITNSGVNSMIRPWIAEWLAENTDAQSRIIVHTTKTKKYEISLDVDGVSSASSIKDVKVLAKDYVGRIVKKISDAEASEPQ